MNPVVSILMPALSTREQTLSEEIKKQIFELGEDSDLVEFLTEIDEGQVTSGRKRNALVEKSKGSRICFVDDDDQIDKEYVKIILEASLDNSSASVITFNLLMKGTKRRRGRSIKNEELWRFGLWNDDRSNGKMSANHLCAWRRDLATMVSWDPALGYADDQVWYQPLLNMPLLRLTRHHIDRTLYVYQYSQESTQNQKLELIKFAKEHANGLRCYLIDSQVYVEQSAKFRKPGVVIVRDRSNSLHEINEESITPFHVVNIK